MQKVKTALVTGGTRGIGFAVAQKLSDMGYEVAVCGRSPKYDLPFKCYGADIGSSVDRQQLMSDFLRDFERIDLLVNNAGVAPKVRADLLEMNEESFDFVLDTNLKGTFFLTQLASKQMLEQKCGQIINISSVSAYATSINRGEYCMAKAGISMLTALYADRLAQDGINVYEIRPGIIETDMTAGVSEKYNRLISDGITPIRRWGKPCDIANAVGAIASGLFAFSTGEVFNIDGGFHLRRF